ncbi:relaxase/mobilization nuclease domain-containing protein [Pseudoclavibacter alba]|nr:relaxase/mobilization nuclease domain-containing protein [Pseudoclavibacter alba]
MSTVNVQASESARSSVMYALYGRGADARRCLAEGATRAAVLTTSEESADAFIMHAEACQRRVQTYNYVQAFSPDEFDVDSPADVARVHELGVKLAERLHTAAYVVVTHTDSAGGHLHNHIYVANHDSLTGRALSQNTSWRHGVRRINDELMADEGCQVLPEPERARPDWDIRRDAFAVGGFEQVLGDRVADALMDPRSVDRAGFEAALADREVRLAVTDRDGWSYKMRRADNGKWGRKKASALSHEFTAEAAEHVFKFHRKKNKKKEEGKTNERVIEAGAGIDFGKLSDLDLEVRRLRAAAVEADDVDHGADEFCADLRPGDWEAAGSAADLARARAHLDAAARRRDEEEAERDRENARLTRGGSHRPACSDASRRAARERLAARGVRDGGAGVRRDEGFDLEL